MNWVLMCCQTCVEFAEGCCGCKNWTPSCPLQRNKRALWTTAYHQIVREAITSKEGRLSGCCGHGWANKLILILVYVKRALTTVAIPIYVCWKKQSIRIFIRQMKTDWMGEKVF